jgi:hypothetical protein
MPVVAFSTRGVALADITAGFEKVYRRCRIVVRKKVCGEDVEPPPQHVKGWAFCKHVESQSIPFQRRTLGR